MITKYKIVPFCPYHFVRTILSNTILSVYHFVHTILSVPFCPLPFCPVTDQPAQKNYIIINVSHIVCCLSKCEINSSIITLFLPSHFYNCNQGFKQSITVIKPKMHKNTVALDRNTPNLNLPPKYFSSSAPDCT